MSGLAVLGEVARFGTEFAVNDFFRKKVEHREDNAVQRRVKDLIAAGLSPTLAAGSAASTSGPMQVRGPDLGNAINQAENTAISKENSRISRMNANTQLKMARIALLRGAADIATTHAQLQLLEQQKRKMKAEADVAEHDAGIYTQMGTPSNMNGSFFSVGPWSFFHHKLSQFAEEDQKRAAAIRGQDAQDAAREAAAKAARAAAKDREERAKAAKGAHSKAANRMIDKYIDRYNFQTYKGRTQ